MGRPENAKLDCFSSWAQHDLLGTPRRGMRRPSLTSRVAAPAAKSSSLHRSTAGARALDLPTLNLAKIRQNLEHADVTSGSDEVVLECQSTPASARGDRRGSILKRSAKESPLFNALSTDPGDHHLFKRGDYHSETARFGDSREKLAKYSYPYSVAQLMNMASNVPVERRFNGDSYLVKNGSVTSRNVVSRDREPSESRLSAEADAKAKKTDSTIQAKKLSLRLVSSLEEALAKVTKSDWETKKVALHTAKDTYSSRYNQEFAKYLNYGNLKEEKHHQQEIANGCRMHEEPGVRCNVEKEPKVKSIKFDTNPSTIPLGFGGNPVESVQTARIPIPANPSESSPRLAFTERGSRKATMSNLQKRKKTDAPTFPTLPPGVLATPEIVLKHCSCHMSSYEQQEILPYLEVYFIGAHSQKIRASSTPGHCNYGFDDERGDYIVVERDHLAYRYEVLGVLGKGSFGQVLKCIDHKCKTLRAVKVIRNKKRFHQQALIEVRILEHLRQKAAEESANYNIVAIHESFYFRGHLCISFELHDISLYDLIKKNNFQGINMAQIREIAVQVLTALTFLRKLHIIHCDLKPENILLQAPSSSKVKVIDFGSSCFEHEKFYTYIQSRFYRSPEVILGLPYDMMIDVWSFGCILAELCSGCPLFPGENEVEQLACMMEILGVPPDSVLEHATRKKMFFDSSNHPRIVPNSWGKKYWPGTKNLATAIRCNDPQFLSFLESCLHWDKNQRLSPEDLLQHSWIVEVHSSGYRLPLQPSNQDTTKRRSSKTLDAPQRSSKQSKQSTTTTSVIKSHHLKLSNLACKLGSAEAVLPPISEGLTMRNLPQQQDKRKAL